MSELLRLKAEIAHRCERDSGSVVAILEQALALAREQGARAWELRAAVDLATRLAGIGHIQRAVDCLVAALPPFSPADETKDVARANALLGSLGGARSDGRLEIDAA